MFPLCACRKRNTGNRKTQALPEEQYHFPGLDCLTDYNGGVLIKEYNYTYPVWVYDYTRADIGNDQDKAKKIRAQCLEEYMV